MAVVYIHKKYSDGFVFYVGIGKTIKRAYSKANRNIHWKRTVEKYGYTVEILEDNVSWEQACLFEKELIRRFGRKDLKKGSLVNVTDGGEGVINYTYTDEVRLKMSLIKKGITSPRKGVVLSQETKDKISKSKKGVVSKRLGKKISEEHRLKIQKTVKENCERVKNNNN